MYDCELTNADLGHLVGSSHQSTLQELNDIKRVRDIAFAPGPVRAV